MYLLLIPFGISLFLLFSRARNLQNAPFKHGDRVLIVTAHPDDETIFFSPTIVSLIRARIPVSILCLSNGGTLLLRQQSGLFSLNIHISGGAYGLGSVREKEMIEACKELKVRGLRTYELHKFKP
jgi:N-acetylglucosaminylphosphatidylinositol deacetylase